jgi:pimeloyl-ACP methyl ester carboxylesterase
MKKNEEEGHMSAGFAGLTKRLIAAAVAALLSFTAAGSASAQDYGASIKVERLVFDVTLANTPLKMVGYLYYHGSYQNRPLQVLLHGATYNHKYWDFPSINGRDYSYARYMAVRKYAVLALDLPGAGESVVARNAQTGAPAGPDGFALTLGESAAAVNQVLIAMKSGANPTAHAFSPVVLVGHSAGSINATVVQGAFGHPADALVVTGSRHLTGQVLGIPEVQGLVQHLLALVQALAPLEYFQLAPAIRTALFYNAAGADAAVIAVDNLTMDWWSNGELFSTFVAFLDPRIDQPWLVNGKVLIQVSQHDNLFPGVFMEDEAALWSGTTPAIQVLTGIGHDFNLHLGRVESWRGIHEWLRANGIGK